MPVLLEARSATIGGPSVDATTRTPCLEIGLLNNLSDGGLKSGERQFIGLLEAAAGDLVIRLTLYSLPQIQRGPATRERIGALYSDMPSLLNGRLDGLIVTGAEPVADRLSDEPFWAGLTAVIDWAEHNTRSTIWSCLAAHAAVLHLDGIERQTLATKRSGIFTYKRACDHALLAGIAPNAGQRVPHSRHNDLLARDLAAHGYEILTRSPSFGVDTFVKQWRSLFVYLQGHPEYDAPALAREFRRDMLRYLNRESEHYPGVPENYFRSDVETALRDFEILARGDRVPEVMSAFPIDFWDDSLKPERWRQDSTRLLRNWLLLLASSKSRASDAKVADFCVRCSNPMKNK